MIECPHCGASNQPSERFCQSCSLDLEARPARAKESSFISTRTIIILLLIVFAGGLLLWFMAAAGAGGLSDK
jgi:hypothetical protein